MLVDHLATRVYVEDPPRINPAKIAADHVPPLPRPVCGNDNPTTWLAARLQSFARIAAPLAEGAALTAGCRQVTGIDPSFISAEGLWGLMPMECSLKQFLHAMHSDVLSAAGSVPPGDLPHRKIFKLH